jgi:serine protease Do
MRDRRRWFTLDRMSRTSALIATSGPRRPLAVMLAAGLLVSACGGSSGEGVSSQGATSDLPTTVSPTEPPITLPPTDSLPPAPETTVDAAAAEVTGIDQVQPAVIQIEARGTIRSPEVGLTDGSGRGSGFIISPDGLAVTNNHVVTGAATLEVFVGGDTSKSYNATVVGVSECNDLALIDINESEPLPTLSWYSDPIKTGLEVYAAGFPLGETEYTLTRGIVAKLSAGGETSWASLDSVLEHDANIQPGNSGGPLVAADGRVVGINYKGRDITGTTQFYAIDEVRAQQVVEKLKSGDFESIGVNGEAVVDEEAGIAGIWVSGVAPGSPASELGVLAGDIIQSMNGLPVGTDGTMSAYCDVLRTSGDRPISVELLRFDTEEILSGELNGTKPLTQTFSFAQAVEDETTVAAGGSANYDSYTAIVDDSNTLTIEVPTAWTDVSTAAVALDDGTTLPLISASTDLAQFESTYNVPGMVFTSFGPIDDIDATLAEFAPAAGECVDGGTQDYNDATYFGRYQVWTECGGVGAVLVVLVAVPAADAAYTALIAMQITSEADLAALDQAFATFFVVA